MDTEVLAKLIDAKHELLRQLHQLAKRQADLVEQDDISRMIQVLAVKQRLLQALEQIEKQLDPFRHQDPDQRVWFSPERRREVREASQRCDALLQEIMQLERGCESQLCLRRDETAAQLQGAHLTAHVVKAYAGTYDPSGRQFDASCDS